MSMGLLDLIVECDLLLIRRVGRNSFLQSNRPHKVASIAISALRNVLAAGFLHVYHARLFASSL